MLSIEESGSALDRLAHDEMAESGNDDYSRAFGIVLADPRNCALKAAYADLPRQPGEEPRSERPVAASANLREYGGRMFDVHGISRLVDQKTVAFAAENGLKYSEAMREILDCDPGLKEAYGR